MQPFGLRFRCHCYKIHFVFCLFLLSFELKWAKRFTHSARKTRKTNASKVCVIALGRRKDWRCGGPGGLTLDVQRGQQYPYPRKHPHGCSRYPESVWGGSITWEWDERGLTGGDGQQHQACNFCKSSSAREAVLVGVGSPVESLVLARLVGGLQRKVGKGRCCCCC